MNERRIVEIRSSDGFTSLNPWREGAKNLVEKTILTNVSDLTIPDEVQLVLSQDQFNVSVENSFDQPFEEILKKITGSSIGSLATDAASLGLASYRGENTKFNPWFKNLKSWSGSRVSINSLSFEFAMGQFGLWNAKYEVFAPILGLLSLALPQKQDILTSDGSFISTAALIGRYVEEAGNFIRNYAENNTDGEGLLGNISNHLENVLQEGGTRYYHVNIGDSFTLQYCIFSAATVNLSTEVDEEGYPVRGTVNVSLEGTVPPALQTTNNLSALRFGPRGV